MMYSARSPKVIYWQSEKPTFEIKRTKKILNQYSGDYTVYVIDVIDYPVQWTVERRWSAFEELKESIEAVNDVYIDFPSTSFFENKFSEAVIAKRAKQLQDFLNRLSSNARILQSKEFYYFFSPPRNLPPPQVIPAYYPPPELYYPQNQFPINPQSSFQQNPEQQSSNPESQQQPSQEGEQQADQQQGQQPNGQSGPILPQVIYSSNEQQQQQQQQQGIPPQPYPQPYYAPHPQYYSRNQPPMNPYARPYPVQNYQPPLSPQRIQSSSASLIQVQRDELREKEVDQIYQRIASQVDELLLKSLDVTTKEEDATFKYLLEELKQGCDKEYNNCVQTNFISHSLKFKDLIDTINQRINAPFEEPILPSDDTDHDHKEAEEEVKNEIPDNDYNDNEFNPRQSIQIVENINNNNDEHIDNDNQHNENNEHQIDHNVSEAYSELLGVQSEDKVNLLLQTNASFDKFSSILGKLEQTLFSLIAVIHETSADDSFKVKQLTKQIHDLKRNLVMLGSDIPKYIRNFEEQKLLENRLRDIQDNIADLDRSFADKFSVRNYSAEKATEFQVQQAMKAHRQVEDEMFDL